MNHFFCTFRWCLITAFLVCAVLGDRPAAAQSTVLERAEHDVAVLTADTLFGRGYQPDGARRAARYIRAQFEEAGLDPLDRSGYFQSFPITVDIVTEVPSLVINGDSLEPGVEFVPQGITGGGSIPTTAEVVSVGTGLVLPERGFNAYESLNISGKVVLIDREVPESIRSDTDLTPRAWSLTARIETAVDRGAAAVLVAADRLIYSLYQYETSVPVLAVVRDVLEDVDTVSLDVAVSQNESLSSKNVIGVIEGTTKPDSLLMLTAHYDHVGSWGRSMYFPGANDNASGTALLLALARYLEEHPLPYSVVCVAFSGEEQGLLGSRYFAEDSPVDLSQVRFLLNFDMVASGTQGFMAVGGTDFPAEYGQLKAVGDSLGIGPIGRRANAPNSDHYPLTERGVRGLFIYSRGGDQPYHHVKDIMDTLDWEVFLDAYTLAVAFLERLSA